MPPIFDAGLRVSSLRTFLVAVVILTAPFVAMAGVNAVDVADLAQSRMLG